MKDIWYLDCLQFELDLNCAELIAIKNGHFKVIGNYFGAKVVYNCDKDYFMSGPKERTCQGDRSWSEHPPTCRREGNYTAMFWGL